VASKEARAPFGELSPAGSGEALATARKNRSGGVAVRSTSIDCVGPRPARSRS
jgi:hypothetical protein